MKPRRPDSNLKSGAVRPCWLTGMLYKTEKQVMENHHGHEFIQWIEPGFELEEID